MSFRRKLALGILFCFPLALPVRAQSEEGAARQQMQQPPQQPHVIRTQTELVLVDVTVKDHAGRVIGGLTAQDFEIMDNGVPQKVSYFGQYQMPLAVALVVDLSASIQPFLTPLRYASETALQVLKPEDEVALFTFSSQVDRRVDLTHDKSAIASQIATFTTGGATNINGALYDAAEYLAQEAPSSRRVIILVSDNVGTAGGGIGSKDVTDEVLKAGASLFSLKVPGENPEAAKIASHFFLNVAKAAEDTGGEVFDVRKEGSLYVAFEALLERLKTRYTIGYSPQGVNEASSVFHALEIRLTASHGKPDKDYKILAERGYYPKPSPAVTDIPHK